MLGTAGRPNSAVCEVSIPGPSAFTNRSVVTVTWGWRSANPATAFSASTMSASSWVRGGCGRPISSVKKAGSSRSQP